MKVRRDGSRCFRGLERFEQTPPSTVGALDCRQAESKAQTDRIRIDGRREMVQTVSGRHKLAIAVLCCPVFSVCLYRLRRSLAAWRPSAWFLQTEYRLPFFLHALLACCKSLYPPVRLSICSSAPLSACLAACLSVWLQCFASP